VESSKILSVLNIEPAKGLFLDLPAEREWLTLLQTWSRGVHEWHWSHKHCNNWHILFYEDSTIMHFKWKRSLSKT
jgi:hypothetical protein